MRTAPEERRRWGGMTVRCPYARRACPRATTTPRSTSSIATSRQDVATPSPSSTTPGRTTYAELTERANRFANALERPGLPARGPHPRGAAGQRRLPDRVPRRDQGGRHPDPGQHAADRRRLRPDAGRQRCARAGGLRAAAAEVRRGPAGQARRAPSSSRAARATRCRPCWPVRRRSTSPRPRMSTTSASGSIPRARPARPRARCTCTRDMVVDGRALRQPILGIGPRRRRLLRRQAVLRLWPRQRADLPAARSAPRRC